MIGCDFTMCKTESTATLASMVWNSMPATMLQHDPLRSKCGFFSACKGVGTALSRAPCDIIMTLTVAGCKQLLCQLAATRRGLLTAWSQKLGVVASHACQQKGGKKLQNL